jgi:transcriptional regulator with XRE-family HTH domain
MKRGLKKFGADLKKLRISQNLSLREICKKVDYDASNWSKIERGVISPPNDRSTLSKWGKTLGLKNGSRDFDNFIDKACIAQSIIPEDILARKDAAKLLPAMFRTLRNEKPTKKEIDRLIELIRNA